MKKKISIAEQNRLDKGLYLPNKFSLLRQYYLFITSFNLRNRVPAMSSLCGTFCVVKTLLENIAFIFTSEKWHSWSDSSIASANMSTVLYGR